MKRLQTQTNSLWAKHFKADFPHEINAGGLAIDLEYLRPSRIVYGFKIYRALDKLVLEDEEGRLFITRID